MRLHVSRKIRFYLPGGMPVLLEPGVATELPDAAALELMAKVPDFVTPLSDDWRDRDHDPRAPIQPGWFIMFRKDGQLRGGPDDGDLGRVHKVVRHEGQWRIFTHRRLIVSERSVRSVHAVNAHGQSTGVWLVKEHGLDGLLDGDAEPRLRLLDLEPDQRQTIMDRFHLSPEVYEALATGTWTPELWAQFWRTDLLVHIAGTDAVSITADECTGTHRALAVRDGLPTLPDLTRRRARIIVQTSTGVQELAAWVIGDALAIHRSIARRGWTLGHVRTGHKILSGIRSKDDALDAARQLLVLPGCDWTASQPIPVTLRDTVLTVLGAVPPSLSRTSRGPPVQPVA